MAWNILRTFVNRGGVTYDSAKTTTIFAEDMNKLKDNDEYLKATIEALPAIPTLTSNLTNDSGFINNGASLGDLIASLQNFIDDLNESDLISVTSAVHSGDATKITLGQLLEMSFLYSSTSFATGQKTLTNKRINARITISASYTTDTGTALNIANCDEFVVTAQAGALKFNNPGGTPLEGQKLIIRIKDNGTARALTYDTQFRAIGVTLPTITVVNKTLYLGLIYNFTDTKWDCVAVAQEA